MIHQRKSPITTYLPLRRVQASRAQGGVSKQAPDGLAALDAELSPQEAMLKDLTAVQKKHLPPVSDPENKLEGLRSA